MVGAMVGFLLGLLVFGVLLLPSFLDWLEARRWKREFGEEFRDESGD